MRMNELKRELKALKIDPETISFFTGLNASNECEERPDSVFTSCDLSGEETMCATCVALTTDGYKVEFDASEELVGGHLGRLAGAF